MKIFFAILKLFKNSRFLRFCLVGSGGVVTNLAVFYICREFIKLPLNLAAIMAFAFAVTQNYYLNHKWTFYEGLRLRPNVKNYLKYVFLNLISLGINLVVTNLVLRLSVFAFPEVVAQGLGVVAGFVFTYAGSIMFVFARKINLSHKSQNFLPDQTQINQKGVEQKVILYFIAGLAVFGIIYIGQVMAVIGSKSILLPITIQAQNKDGQTPSSFERYMQLARAGNYTHIKPQAIKGKEWTVENVFIKKVLVGMSTGDLESLSQISVKIGNKDFIFSKNEFLKTWEPVELSVLKGNLSGHEPADFKVYESPASVRASNSGIFVYKAFFKNLINWAGDDMLLFKPFVRSVLLLMLAAFLFIFIKKFFTKTKSLINEAEILQQKKQYIILSLTLLAWVVLLVLLNNLLAKVYKPNIASILAQAQSEFVVYIFKSIRPKPLERMQFILSTLLSPFALYFLYSFINKKFLSIPASLINKIYKYIAALNIFFVGSLIYLGLAISSFYYVSDSFFAGTWTKFLYVVLIFPAAVVLFFKNKINFKYGGVIGEVFAYLLIALVFCLSVINVNDRFQPTDLDPVIYPVVQVMAGKSLLAPVTSFYGLYPFFIKPIFSLIGFSVLKFSLIFGLLVALSFICLKQSLKILIKNKIFYYLGFFALVFYTVLATRMVPEYYFQYWPIRFLFPSMGIYLAAKYLTAESKLLYWLSFVIFSIGIFWNFDVGAVLFISWLGALIYNQASKKIGLAHFAVKTLKHVASGLFVFLLVTLIFALITRMLSGQFPNFSLLLPYQKIFLFGYLNIPLVPPPHAWAVVILIYLAGLLLSARALYHKNISYTIKIVFFLSTLGLGLFAYYEGQSSDTTLFRTSYPAIILALIFTHILWERIKNYGSVLYGELAAVLLALFILFSVPFSLLANSGKYYGFVKMAVNNILLKDSAILRDAGFIKSFTNPGEKVLILAKTEQGVYYTESKTRPVLNIPSVADIVFIKDTEILLNFLNTNSSTKIFAKTPLEIYDIYDSRIRTVLESRYKLFDATPNGLGFYRPK